MSGGPVKLTISAAVKHGGGDFLIWAWAVQGRIEPLVLQRSPADFLSLCN